MRKPMAAIGTVIFFVLAPGVVAGLVPWWLTGWQVRQSVRSLAWAPLRVAGVALLASGTIALVHAFVRFVAEGSGTPAPLAPTQRLVVGGLYRYVRNPMYVAVAATIVGQALVLGRPTLLGYAAAVTVAMAAFAHLYEEPALADQFGAEYEAYRHAVPAWWPGRHPWVQAREGRSTPENSGREAPDRGSCACSQMDGRDTWMGRCSCDPYRRPSSSLDRRPGRYARPRSPSRGIVRSDTLV